MAPGSAEATFWPRADAVFRTDLARYAGDLALARAAAKGAREALLQIQPDSEFGRQRVAQYLRQLHLALGWVEIETGDFAAAEVHFGHVAEARKSLPTTDNEARRNHALDNALWALTLARTGRVEQARSLAEKSLAFERALDAGKPDDQMHKINFVVALVAAALCNPNPPQARALASEAQTLFESLPAEARRLHSSQLVSGLITEARRVL